MVTGVGHDLATKPAKSENTLKIMLHKHTHLSKLVLFSSAPLNRPQIEQGSQKNLKTSDAITAAFPPEFRAQTSLPQVV